MRDERLWSRGDVVLCACSGGPDSSALLHVVALLRRTLGHEVIAHGVDHGLREAAAGELELARAIAQDLNVPFSTSRLDIAAGSNLQARARSARFAALEEVARRQGARVIATGHTADDRAETVLLRLLRGSGPRGLAALPPRAAAPVDRVRPLIRARRADVLAHLHRHRLCYADDPSNLDTRFSRVRVRHELLPLLVELSPGIVEHLCALADMMGRPFSPEDPLQSLGRAQRQAIERAQHLGERSLRLRLHGGQEVEVTLAEGGAVLLTRV